MRWDLKRVDGKTVQWDGDTGEAAAIRYVDNQRVFGKDDGGGIVATRLADEHRHGIFQLDRRATITP